MTILTIILLSAVVLLAVGFLFAASRGKVTLEEEQSSMLIRIGITALLLVVLLFLTPALQSGTLFGLSPEVTRYLLPVLYLIPWLLIGWDILREAFEGIREGELLDENFLMAVATIGAFVLAFIESGEYTEAVAVMLFFRVGEWFEDYGVGRSCNHVRALMDLRPDFATVSKGGEWVRVSPSDVAPGDLFIVRPGERVPLDGIVTEGQSSLNTAALTGESAPRHVVPGDEVLSGCVSINGALTLRATKSFGESTVSRILDLMENAADAKSRSESFITRFAEVYTPVVCALALVVALGIPAFRALILGADSQFLLWIRRALTFLVISCPCALVLSIPLSCFAGLGGASRAGILMKSSGTLEALADTSIVAFDKTGTLTRGEFTVREVLPVTLSADALLELAAHAEIASVHPIAAGIRAAYGKEPDLARVTDIREIAGQGVTAMVDGQAIAAGSLKLMEMIGIREADLPSVVSDDASQWVCISVDGTYAGLLRLSDAPRENAARAISALSSLGIRKTVMLTGDAITPAHAIAKVCGITEVHAALLPQDKVSAVEALLAEKEPNTRVVFVGDGINDAPVLVRADIGVSMGGIGSDAAMEAADVVLMDDDPLKLVTAIRHARHCVSVIRQNIVFAIAVKVLCLLLSLFGITNMFLAIFADVGVMILCVLSAMRCLRVRHEDASH